MGIVSDVCGKYQGLFVNWEAWLHLSRAAAADQPQFVGISGAFK